MHQGIYPIVPVVLCPLVTNLLQHLLVHQLRSLRILPPFPLLPTQTSQLLFVFKRQEPSTQMTQYPIWVALPQGFQDSLYFFGQAITKDSAPLMFLPDQTFRTQMTYQSIVQESLLHIKILFQIFKNWPYNFSLSRVQIFPYKGLSSEVYTNPGHSKHFQNFISS